MKTATLCLEQGPAVVRAWILQTVAFASILNTEPHAGGQTGTAGSREAQFAGEKTRRRTKVEQEDFREKVLPEQGFEERVRVCQEARRQNQRDLQGREGSSLRSVFQSSYLCSARLHQVLFVGFWRYRGLPTQPRAQGRSGSRWSCCRTGGNTLLSKSRLSVHQRQTETWRQSHGGAGKSGFTLPGKAGAQPASETGGRGQGTASERMHSQGHSVSR